MANATRRGNLQVSPFGDFASKYGAVSTAQVFYPNALVGLNTSGYLDKFGDTAVMRFAGVTQDVQTEVLSGGSNGDVLIDVNQPRFIKMNFDSVAITDVGRNAYATDDQNASLAPGTYGNLIGRVAQYLSATLAWVEAMYFVGGKGQPYQVLSASGAVSIRQSICFITKSGVAALTIADPTSGTDDGVVMEFISTTASAHTLDNSAGSGFNAGGAATDVGTFGGAKGDNIRIMAYQGKWYVQSKTNVTLA